MSVFETIRNLGSFKECESTVIPRRKVGKILEAGRHAPSPGNVQSLEFVVVEDGQKKEIVADLIGDKRLEEAPDIVVLVGDLARMSRRVGEDLSHESCNAEAACAAQNMRLAALEEGVASFWATGFDEGRIADLLSIPGDKTPLGVVALGFSEERVSKPAKFGLNEVCFYDEYGNQLDSVFDGFEFKGIKDTSEMLNKKSEGFVYKLRRKIGQYL